VRYDEGMKGRPASTLLAAGVILAACSEGIAPNVPDGTDALSSPTPKAPATGGSATGGSTTPRTTTIGTGPCVDNVLCVAGDHWDSTACKCVPNATDAGAGDAGGGGPCVETVLCIVGDHWDSTLCKCVPNPPPPDAGAPDDGGTCVDNVLCILGYHWDSGACKCVPNAQACMDAGECRGFLPALCLVCADGATACAHWTCTAAGTCAIAYCP
jgi:hypothetical protein